MLGMLEHWHLASIAFMLITGIMGYKITVTIIASVTVEDVEEAKVKGKGRSTIYDAIPMDDSILAMFPRSDEFKKALELESLNIHVNLMEVYMVLYKIAMLVIN